MAELSIPVVQAARSAPPIMEEFDSGGIERIVGGVVLVMARTACTLYWFHPLVWMASRRLCLESERACDDAVLRGAEPTVYAEHLVSLAKRLSKGPAAVLSMAGRTDLSTRVRAVLDTGQARGRAGTSWTVATLPVSLAFASSFACIGKRGTFRVMRLSWLGADRRCRNPAATSLPG